MAFANVWDTTFPPDTQLANLLGQDIRNGVKVDVQQRMAAISGLDAAKPAFGGDAQPANWNGILFFATDTGKIYQFNNPSWTDVTSNFTTKSSALKAVNQVTHTGTVTLDTIYTLNIPANIIGTTGRVRMTAQATISTAVGIGTMRMNFGATVIGQSATANSGGAPKTLKVVVEGGNTGATNTQRWDGFVFDGSGAVVPFSFCQSTSGAVDTTAGVTVTLQYQSGNAGDSQTFDFFTIEFF